MNITQPEKDAPLILVIEDDKFMRIQLHRAMEQVGYRVAQACDGEEGLAAYIRLQPDIVLLDALMPVMDGFACCAQLKAQPETKQVPVLMITSLEDKQSVNKAFEVGAIDYVTKPIHWPVLLQRVRRIIKEAQLYKELLESQAANEKLLLNTFPKPIVERLKKVEWVIADQFDNVSVLFADMVGFTRLASQIYPTELILKLNSIFSEFDQLTERYGLEKIKTIGDGYMVASGLQTPREDNADAMLEMALAMQETIEKIGNQTRENLKLRIGINSGPVVAGVIGIKKFSYDLWGDTVNTASRMEKSGFPGWIQVTEATYKQLSKKHLFTAREAIDIKGKGKMKTFLLDFKEYKKNAVWEGKRNGNRER